MHVQCCVMPHAVRDDTKTQAFEDTFGGYTNSQALKTTKS